MRTLGTATALLVLLTACGPAAPVSAPSSAAPPPSPPPRVFDPPTRFAPVGIPLPPDLRAAAVVLHGSTLFGASPAGLHVVDALTGQLKATVAPRHPGTAMAEPGRPVVAVVAGVPAVLAAISATAPGAGTIAARPTVELLAARADDGTSIASVTVDLDPKEETGPAAVAGVAGSTAVVRVGRVSYGVDIQAGRTVWRQASFSAGAVAGDVVAGSSHVDPATTRLAAIGAADGRPRWTDEQDATGLTIQAGGPKIVVVTGADYRDGRGFYRLTEATTGRTVESGRSSSRIGYDLGCHYDGAGVTACSMRDWAAAFDAQTGKWLWELPDKAAGRTAITVTTAWHGAVYGTTGNGPLVLDGRTGKDRETAPGATAELISGTVAVSTDGTLHRTTG